MRCFWMVGMFMLAAAQGIHAYEHWEIAANNDCVAHAHDHGDHGDHGDSGPKHEHGCTSHDHAPALAGGIFVLTVCMSAEPFVVDLAALPMSRASSIDHPPQLS